MLVCASWSFRKLQLFKHALAMTECKPKIIIFRLKNVPSIDMTGLEIFDEIIQHYSQKGITGYLCEANAKVSRKLEKVGILRRVAHKKVFDSMEEMTARLAALP
jgi:sulfate permease, SulP family